MRADVCSSEAHERLKRDSDAWALLVSIGTMQLDSEEPVLELRNCTCGSTLVKEIKPR